MKHSPNTNILYIVDGLPAGGVERQIVELLKGLKPSPNIKTTLCSLSTGSVRAKRKLLLSQIRLSIVMVRRMPATHCCLNFHLLPRG